VLANSVTVSLEARRMACLLARGTGAAHAKRSMTSYSTVGLVSMTSSDRVVVAGRNLGRDGDVRTMG